MRKRNGVRRFATLLTAAAMLSTSVTAPADLMTTASAAEADAAKTDAAAPDVIKNGDFTDADMSAWSAMLGSSKITAETSDTPVYGDVKTYGKIDRDPAKSETWESFAQDITDQVKDYNGAVYSYEFYAMLSDDYKDAPASQREIGFAPVLTADGDTQYMGGYSADITGTATQTLEPGKWTKFSGTFKVQWKSSLEKLVLRVIEQGENYGSGPCVKGDYCLAGFKMIRTETPKKEIEKDVPSLKNVIAAANGLGTDAIVGTSLTNDEITDETLMALVEKHFNAVTLGNELKLDCMLGYNNDAHKEGGITKGEINGQTIDVPVLDHSRADKMLDVILKWNEANPGEKIRVRGHVLVWHSQAPEWFFHEDYDAKKDYVSKETMNLRLEWYIKTMLTYYTGADSKYKDLFYGWDVVNEAISGDHYRNDINEGTGASSWWKVYKSNEYIINAFTFANKYAPASLELYYNDYGECDPTKTIGISQLLKDVKAKAGAPGVGTRIDAFGMQAHYNLVSPTAAEIEKAVRAYTAIVGKVQITEFDMAASNDFDGTEATLSQEYVKQAYKYKEVYETLCKLDKEKDVEVSGFTIWGVLDGHSWLQTATDIGGGSTTGNSCCPLFFDDNYKVKPCYWAIVDPSKLEPFINTITLIQSEDGSYSYGETYSFEGQDTKVDFVPVWNENGISVKVEVEDAAADAEDAVTVYYVEKEEIKKVTVKRTEATAIEGGYQAEVQLPLNGLKVRDTVMMDVLVQNKDVKAAYNDLKLTQDTSSKYFAKAVVKPFTEISKGTVKVDGTKDAVWGSAVMVPLQIVLGAKATADAKALWDEENLYVYFEIKDSVLNSKNENAWEQDSIEVFIDENNGKTDSYEDDDKQYRISFENKQSFNGKKCTAENVTSAVKTTSDGYVVEAAFKWTDLQPKAGSLVGLEYQVNDADASGARIGTVSWYDETGNGWGKPSVFGTAALGEAKPVPADDSSKTAKKPAKVTGVKKVKATAKTVKISWKKAASAKKYEVTYTVGKKSVTKTTTKTSYTIKSLKKNTKVQIKVRGVNGNTKGAYSKVLKVTTKKK